MEIKVWVKLMNLKDFFKQLSVKAKLKLLTGDSAMTAVNLEEYGIVSILMGDGPNGIKSEDGSTICFLNTCLMASSWDEEVCFTVGQMLANEVKKHGIDLLLAPAINIKRNPLCGRNFEYYSEDPLLTGKLASAFINGLKSNGLCVCAKHFACNNQETGRWAQDSIIDDNTLRNVYLKAFEYVVKNTEVDCIMASYNKVNGTYACQNKYLLEDILRKEWGYSGVVISDWCASVDVVASVNSGMDLEMPGNVHNSLPKLSKAYENGELNKERVDESACRLLKLSNKVSDYRKKEIIEAEVNVEALVKLTGEAMVLLKNEGALPLKRKEKILLVGNAKSPRIQGGGCAELKTQTVLTPYDEILAFSPECVVVEDYNDIGNYSLGSYDKIVVFMYLGKDCDSEAFDRENIEFPAEQVRAVEEVVKRNKNVVAVLQNGSAVDLSFDETVNAVIEGYYFGSYGARALAKVLYGEITPSGKLAETFPLSYKDVPTRHEFGEKEKILYNEREFLGYRYYTSFEVQAKYPFGYGLSYCDFEWNEPIIVEKGDFLYNLSVKIKNNSKQYSGKETVQVYLKTDDLSIPKMQLIAFETVRVEPNESKQVNISLTSENFIRYDNGNKVLPSGDFSICIAKNCQEVFYKKNFGETKNNCTFNAQTLMREVLTNNKCRSITMEYMQGIINLWAFGDAETEKNFEEEKFLKESVYSMPIRAFTYFDCNLFDEKRMETLLRELNK